MFADSPDAQTQADVTDYSGPELSGRSLDCVTGPSGHGGHRLSDQQREFARQYVLTGGNATKAAALANYTWPEKAGFRNLVHPSILHEIKRISIVHTEALLPIAIRQLVEIMCNPELDARARVQAATALLDRGGMKPKSDGPAVQVNVQVNGATAQAAIADVWKAREQRLSGSMSDIADGMSDIQQPVIDHVAAVDPAGAGTPQGGGNPQGPVAVPVSIPPHSPEHPAPIAGRLNPGENE